MSSQNPLNEKLQKTFYIPKGKSGYVIGHKSTHLNQMKVSSGADIRIMGTRNNPCQAIIKGTAEQIKMAVMLLQDTLVRSYPISPSIGFTLLNVSDEYESRYFGSDIKIISFNKASNDDHETIPFDKYIFEINALPTCPYPYPSTSITPESHVTCKNCNPSDFSTNSLSGKVYKFSTIQMLEPCLNHICEDLIYEKKITADEEFRLKVCFGKVIFTKIEQTSLTLCEWNGLKRGHKGVTTSFNHDVGSPERDYLIERLIQDFGFRQVNLVEETVITILFTERNTNCRMKLYFDPIDSTWKIRKLTKNIYRHAIIDIVSGKESPDLRFLIKSQIPSFSIVQKYHTTINNIQRSNRFLGRMNLINGPLPLQLDCSKMYIRQSDFVSNRNFKCTSVRQSIIKKQFINGIYTLNFMSTLQDEEGRVTSEDTVNLIHHSWITPSFSGRAPINPEDPKFHDSIIESINLARRLTEMIGR
ncbi:8608_t:CDS:2 [Funneliformis caledonium]|uniref:8608_t:CDS:1 n=1 Tax=Funneliformis caledonium TaxID=1117310 RepID=A0A9N9AQW0_9GLOM|nr:8608_t:CDS:2 [Funneliformis caledonium]